jgi:hypothetical protein
MGRFIVSTFGFRFEYFASAFLAEFEGSLEVKLPWNACSRSKRFQAVHN